MAEFAFHFIKILICSVVFWCFIFSGCESREAIFINVNSHRIYTSYYNINSQIKLELVYQKWVRYIMTGNHSSIISLDQNVFEFVGNVYTFSLGAARWFYDPELRGILLHEHLKSTGLLRKSQSKRYKIKLSHIVQFLHPLDSLYK